MRWLDALLGRSRPAPPKGDQLFAMATGYVTMVAQLGFQAADRAGIVFRPVTSSHFAEFEQELRGILALTQKEMGTQLTIREDSFGFRWAILQDANFEDLVATVHQISLLLIDHGFGEQTLAAVFRFDDPQGKPAYWVYQYKRGAFSPFVPAGQAQERDNATELRLRAIMENELPIELDLNRWYALWDIPI